MASIVELVRLGSVNRLWLVKGIANGIANELGICALALTVSGLSRRLTEVNVIQFASSFEVCAGRLVGNGT